jgi:hypothetical protein
MFIEQADTPAEMRDLIVAWLREQAQQAQNRRHRDTSCPFSGPRS